MAPASHACQMHPGYHNPAQVLIRFKSTIVSIAWSAVGTFAIFKAVAFITAGAGIHETQELQGMDIAFHGEHHISIEAHNIGNVGELDINGKEKESEVLMAASE